MAAAVTGGGGIAGAGTGAGAGAADAVAAGGADDASAEGRDTADEESGNDNETGCFGGGGGGSFLAAATLTFFGRRTSIVSSSGRSRFGAGFTSADEGGIGTDAFALAFSVATGGDGLEGRVCTGRATGLGAGAGLGEGAGAEVLGERAGTKVFGDDARGGGTAFAFCLDISERGGALTLGGSGISPSLSSSSCRCAIAGGGACPLDEDDDAETCGGAAGAAGKGSATRGYERWTTTHESRHIEAHGRSSGRVGALPWCPVSPAGSPAAAS